MNQILITKKLYITPELKRKKKIYKINFIISVCIILILTSFYIYANYDRAKTEETSQMMLAEFNNNLEEKEDTTIAPGDVLVVVLDDEEPSVEIEEETSIVVDNNKGNTTNSSPTNNLTEYTTKEGYRYNKIASINIPKINVQYAILDGKTKSVAETDVLLKISPTKFWGPNPNEIGNFCVVGHNYRNNKFFSKVPTLQKGDIIEITDIENRTLRYSIYDKYEVEPDNLSCTSQLTDGKKEITVITCTNDNKRRVIVKARAV